MLRDVLPLVVGRHDDERALRHRRWPPAAAAATQERQEAQAAGAARRRDHHLPRSYAGELNSTRPRVRPAAAARVSSGDRRVERRRLAVDRGMPVLIPGLAHQEPRRLRSPAPAARSAYCPGAHAVGFGAHGGARGRLPGSIGRGLDRDGIGKSTTRVDREPLVGDRRRRSGPRATSRPRRRHGHRAAPSRVRRGTAGRARGRRARGPAPCGIRAAAARRGRMRYRNAEEIEEVRIALRCVHGALAAQQLVVVAQLVAVIAEDLGIWWAMSDEPLVDAARHPRDPARETASAACASWRVTSSSAKRRLAGSLKSMKRRSMLHRSANDDRGECRAAAAPPKPAGGHAPRTRPPPAPR